MYCVICHSSRKHSKVLSVGRVKESSNCRSQAGNGSSQEDRFEGEDVCGSGRIALGHGILDDEDVSSSLAIRIENRIQWPDINDVRKMRPPNLCRTGIRSLFVPTMRIQGAWPRGLVVALTKSTVRRRTVICNTSRISDCSPSSFDVLSFHYRQSSSLTSSSTIVSRAPVDMRNSQHFEQPQFFPGTSRTPP